MGFSRLFRWLAFDKAATQASAWLEGEVSITREAMPYLRTVVVASAS
jgi:hypothetical protein